MYKIPFVEYLSRPFIFLLTILKVWCIRVYLLTLLRRVARDKGTYIEKAGAGPHYETNLVEESGTRGAIVWLAIG